MPGVKDKTARQRKADMRRIYLSDRSLETDFEVPLENKQESVGLIAKLTPAGLLLVSMIAVILLVIMLLAATGQFLCLTPWALR